MLSLEKENHRKKQPEAILKNTETQAHLVPKVVFFFLF